MQLVYDSGFTVYAVIRRSDGHVYSHITSAFEDWDDDNLTGGDYSYSLDDEGGDLYTWVFPLIIDDDYSIVYYRQAGASPANTDVIIDDKNSLD